MKDLRNKLPVLFAILLVFPLVYQTIHLFDGHGIQPNNDKSINLNSVVEVHDQPDKCLICDFEYVVFLAADHIESFSIQVFLKLDQPLINTPVSFLFQGFNTLLRAPPTSL
jgi:hypothetical protein